MLTLYTPPTPPTHTQQLAQMPDGASSTLFLQCPADTHQECQDTARLVTIGAHAYTNGHVHTYTRTHTHTATHPPQRDE